MTEPAAQAVPRLAADVRYRVVDGKAVVIVQGAGEALVLNEVGTRILELIDGRRSREAIRRRLGEEFTAEPTELADDLGRYLEELAAAGVLATGFSGEPAGADG